MNFLHPHIVRERTARVIRTYENKLWYSEKVKNVVKSRSEILTMVITPQATSMTKTVEERILESYNVS